MFVSIVAIFEQSGLGILIVEGLIHGKDHYLFKLTFNYWFGFVFDTQQIFI